MGSAFRLPIWSGASLDRVVDWCRQQSVKIIGTDAAASLSHTEMDWKGGCALLLGPESTGLRDQELEMVDASVRIPMLGEVESLNVSVAAGILLYEVVRQRQHKVIPPLHKTP